MHSNRDDAGSALRAISSAFKVPISFEWSYVNEDRSDTRWPPVSFSLEAGETLASTLDRFCAATQGQLQWGRIHGIICLWPTGAGGAVESLLDTRVTLHLRGVSTWHAMLELARTINREG